MSSLIPSISDAQEIPALLALLAKESSSGCGCSYEVYVDKFSAAVDRAVESLPEPLRLAVITEAKRSHDYSTATEIAERIENDALAGYCRHGLTSDTCPCGCFED